MKNLLLGESNVSMTASLTDASLSDASSLTWMISERSSPRDDGSGTASDDAADAVIVRPPTTRESDFEEEMLLPAEVDEEEEDSSSSSLSDRSMRATASATEMFGGPPFVGLGKSSGAKLSMGGLARKLCGRATGRGLGRWVLILAGRGGRQRWRKRGPFKKHEIRCSGVVVPVVGCCAKCKVQTRIIY